ncbi:carbohydrate ABC transporter permease [Streptomyces sp. TRM66268-LWL]|uniref:Carbohydrate ABC transporter permease n=2 Tax=Streptomyces polyasparticus TaxID=2767826 RepID=A0ABR7SXS9_9ACTN|nr:carbohydrate ABC transporter permease [Streptomyces polyasparticus]
MSIATGRNRARARKSGTYALLIGIAALFTSPFAWLLITSLKTERSLGAFPVEWLPEPFAWENYRAALDYMPFLGHAQNSLVIAVIQSTLMTLSSAYVGFGFARLRGRGKNLMFGVVMATLMLPHVATLIPTYLIFSKVGLVNTLWPWVMWGLSGSAFLIFMFRQYFVGLPIEMEEAAILDGCGYFRIFFKIFLPQAKPMLATSLILSFTWTWSEFLQPLLLLSSDRTTLAVALATGYQTPQGAPINNLIAAGSTMYVLPVIVLFVLLQRFYQAGSATSGLK